MGMVRAFIRCAGAVLLAIAFVLILTNLSTGDLAQPLDPLLQISLRLLFWIGGGAFLVVALICLFGRWEFKQLGLLAWVSANLAIYLGGLYWTGVRSPAFLFGSLGDTFGVSPKLAMGVGGLALIFLTVGSFGLLILVWLGARMGKWAIFPDQFLKIFCPACGGHIQYAARNTGQQIPCPHCNAEIALRKPENLKMSCYFCKEHIEFPSHAIGKKMPCPHCKMDITLKQPDLAV